MFQFSRQSHRDLSEEIVAALAPIAAKHGLVFSSNGGQIGSAEHIIKIKAATADVNAQANAFGRQAPYYGLEARDFGAVFLSNGRRFKVTGISPSRPKYPIDGECLQTGKQFKFPLTTVQKIIAARSAAPVAPPAPTVPVMQTPQQQIAPSSQGLDGLRRNPLFGAF